MANPSYIIGLTASAGSLALLLGAWAFQSIGYAPCAMCIWQRYPHAIAIILGMLVLFGLRHNVIYLVGAVATASTAGIGIFHTGVERNWWEGPTSCTGSGLDLTAMTPEDLLSTSGPSNLVMCDQVTWEFLTLSMASWNALLSFVFVGLWIFAWVQSTRENAKT